MEKEKNIISVKKSILIILIASFLIDIVLVFFSIGIRYNIQPIFPRTIPILSLLFFSLILIGFSLYWVTKWGLRFDEFLTASLVLAIVFLAFWHFAPSSLKLIEANYYSISTASVDESNQIIFAPTYSGSLYHKKDPAIEDELQKLDENSTKTALNLDSFLFWQTGLLFGHGPLNIDQFDGYLGFTNKLKLFLTIGPLSLLESFLRALTMYFPIGLILLSAISFKEYGTFKPHI